MTVWLARSDGLIETEAAAASPPSQPRRRPRWQTEVLLVVLLYGVYGATRGLRQATVVTADHNGWLLLHAERHLHVAPEHRLNQLLWQLPGLAVPSAYFYATLHFIVTPGVLVWLYRRHPNSYRTARRVLVIATVACLVGFWLFPTAPPRLLPGSGIRDTLADVHQWGSWAGPSSAPRGLSGLANEYAAMPSLHVVWALWAGWLVTRHAHHRLIRIAGVSYPVLTAFVVMATGNHYLLDVLAGAAVLALASVAVTAVGRPRRTCQQPRAAGRAAHRVRRRVLAAALAALLVSELVAVEPYIGRTGNWLRHPNLWWLAAAITVELTSMATFGQMQHRMLRAAGGQISRRKIAAMTYAANAVGMTLPAGTAISSGYTFRRLRAWGASAPSASFTLISSGVLSTSSFALIALAAAVTFGAAQASPAVLVISVIVMAGVLTALRMLSHRPELSVRIGTHLFSVANRLRRRPATTGIEGIHKYLGELSAIRPRTRDWALGLALATSSWAADLLCLFACAKAIGLNGPTLTLIVTSYLAGMSVSGLSLVPAGLGIVDAAMVLTLGDSGVPVATAAAVVLLYRLVSLAFIVTIGWSVWLLTRRHDRHASVEASGTPAVAIPMV
ncbi:MAG: hypothetical protein JWN95_3515 [Frankiales bacterium]|nr:hypothetical protein [Frankiales bacterium]